LHLNHKLKLPPWSNKSGAFSASIRCRHAILEPKTGKHIRRSPGGGQLPFREAHAAPVRLGPRVLFLALAKTTFQSRSSCLGWLRKYETTETTRMRIPNGRI